MDARILAYLIAILAGGACSHPESQSRPVPDPAAEATPEAKVGHSPDGVRAQDPSPRETNSGNGEKVQGLLFDWDKIDDSCLAGGSKVHLTDRYRAAIEAQFRLEDASADAGGGTLEVECVDYVNSSAGGYRFVLVGGHWMNDWDPGIGMRLAFRERGDDLNFMGSIVPKNAFTYFDTAKVIFADDASGGIVAAFYSTENGPRSVDIFSFHADAVTSRLALQTPECSSAFDPLGCDPLQPEPFPCGLQINETSTGIDVVVDGYTVDEQCKSAPVKRTRHCIDFDGTEHPCGQQPVSKTSADALVAARVELEPRSPHGGHIRGGHYGPPVVQRALLRTLPAVRGCYRAMLREGQVSTGRVGAKILFTGSKVTGVALEPDESLKEATALRECVERECRKVSLPNTPETVGKVLVAHPTFVFSTRGIVDK